MDSNPDRESKPSDSTSADAGIGTTRRRMLKGLSAAGVVGAAGCTGGGGGSSGEFVVGANVPLSGGNSLIGDTMVNSAQIAVDEINDNGGLAGTDVSLTSEDNESDPQTGVERTNQLINQSNADMILGPVSSAVRNSMSPICESNETPLLYPTSYEGVAAPDYCNPYLFKTGWVPPQQVTPAIPFLMEEYGSEFYLLGSDYLWPQEMNAAITDAVESNGGSVLNEEYAQLGTTDFSSILVDIDNKDPDILLMTLVGASVPAIQKQLTNREMRGNLTEVGFGHSEPSLEGLSQDSAEGIVNITGYHTNMENEANQAFIEEYESRHGEDAVLGGIGGWTYTTMKLLETAMTDADDASTAAIRENLPGTSMDSIGGPITMSHDHQLELSCVAAEVNADLEFETIESFDSAMPSEQCSEI